MQINAERNIMSLIDDYSAREILEILYAKGIIEMPFLDSDEIVNITSCPINDDYANRRPDFPLCCTDYDSTTGFSDNPPVLNPHDALTTRIAFDITPKGVD
jgi:hypothetical protein